MKSALRLSTAFATMAMFGAGGSAWAADAASSGSTDANGVNDIVVTATRREESANKIPVALQALGGKQLEQLNVTSFEKLVEYLPSVTRLRAVRAFRRSTFAACRPTRPVRRFSAWLAFSQTSLST